MKITDKRVLLYYIINIFLVLNMMIILFVSISMLQSGEGKSIQVFKFFLNTLFFTIITKAILGLLLRLPKKVQTILIFMSLFLAIFILLMLVLITIFNPQIILQLTLLFWGVYTILFNYIVVKNIRQYIPLVVLTSIYAFFTLALFIIMFIDIYKVFFDPSAILTGILSIIIVFVSMEILQNLAYVLIPEYYPSPPETIDLFDEIKLRYDIRERDILEQEDLKTKKIVERKMIERQKRAERERIREERKLNRRKLKATINPLTKGRLEKFGKNEKEKINIDIDKDEVEKE